MQEREGRQQSALLLAFIFILAWQHIAAASTSPFPFSFISKCTLTGWIIHCKQLTRPHKASFSLPVSYPQMNIYFFIDVFVVGNCSWKACAYLRWWAVCEFLFAWTGLSLGKRFLGEKRAARHGANVEQSDPIYTGRHLITISPSVSQVPWFVRAAATVSFNASKALRALMFAQMGQDKVMHLVEHIISSECFAALGQANCSYTINLHCKRDLSRMKITNFPDALCNIQSSSV